MAVIIQTAGMVDPAVEVRVEQADKIQQEEQQVRVMLVEQDLELQAQQREQVEEEVGQDRQEVMLFLLGQVRSAATEPPHQFQVHLLLMQAAEDLVAMEEPLEQVVQAAEEQEERILLFMLLQEPMD